MSKIDDCGINKPFEEFEDDIKKVVDLIFNLTLKGRKNIDIYDVSTFVALGDIVNDIIKKSAKEMQFEIALNKIDKEHGL